jgi:superfamily II DNA or RNA helicase
MNIMSDLHSLNGIQYNEEFDNVLHPNRDLIETRAAPLSQYGGKNFIHPDNPRFYEFINNHYKKYKIGQKKKTFDQFCFPKSYELQIPQKFLAEYINPKTPYDSVLVIHKIGAGKTCTAIRICEAWKRKRKIIVLLPASLTGNFYNELRSECTRSDYITDKERIVLKTAHPSSKEYTDIINKSDDLIHKYYEIYSYNKFVDLYSNNKIKLDDKLLIVDEVQNMVSEGGRFYNVLYDSIKSAKKGLRVVLLSATPIFDKPHEIALTLNLLNMSEEFPTGKDFEKMYIEKIIHDNDSKKIDYKLTNIDHFKKLIRGKISYYRGAPPYTFPKMNLYYVKCKMHPFQYKSYMTVLKDEEKKSSQTFLEGDILDLPTNFFIGARIISNIAYPNKNIGEKGLQSLNNEKIENIENLKKYSIKFYKILSKINSTPGLVFIYSNFKEYGGIKAFVAVLEAHGYKDYVEYGEGKKRYAVWSGDVKPKIREEVKTIFNKKENTDGSRIKIILGSPSMKEGVSLFRVKNVHILEPYWNQARMEQIIGRAVRFCSHKDLDEEEREVDVYVYIAVHPDIEQTIDEHIYNISLNKQKLIKQFDKLLKESAIDCSLFKNANMDEDKHGKSINNYACEN